MGKRLTTEEFIRRAIEIHGDKYDYSLVEYIGNNIKVKLVYNGVVYEQLPSSHLSGHNCGPLSGNTKLTKEEFIFRSKEIHGDKYDYSAVVYFNIDTKVKIIYNGIEYTQKPSGHLNGQKCETPSGNPRLSQEEFISKAKKIHGDKYDYSQLKYTNNRSYVTIGYDGIFYEQLAANHLTGSKCEDKQVASTEDFISKAKKIHGDKYDYSLVNYKSILEDVCIIYNDTIYMQQAYSHLKGIRPKGTNDNNISRGCERIKTYLENNNILYILEYKYKDCKYINTLAFDFFLPDYNLLIEFDGIQHYKPIAFFGGEEAFVSYKIRDNIKNEYCIKNRISLLRIPYFEFKNIENIIKGFIYDCVNH